jgi:hypothetical protein
MRQDRPPRRIQKLPAAAFGILLALFSRFSGRRVGHICPFARWFFHPCHRPRGTSAQIYLFERSKKLYEKIRFG